MDVIGITGGIGAGKSVVSRILRCRGFKVYDCDMEARRLMDASPRVKNEIAKVLGEDCLRSSGDLNRPAIAAKVFADRSSLEWLNSLVHKLVREDIQKWLDDVAKGQTPVFIESAIIHSSGLERFCRRIWLVDAPVEIRIARASHRDNCDKGRIEERINAQQSEFDNLPLGKTNLIINDNLLPLLPQIDTFLANTKN